MQIFMVTWILYQAKGFCTESVAGRGTDSRARKWALVYHLEMNYPKIHTCWQTKRPHWEGAPGWRAGGWGNPGELLCTWHTVSGFMMMGLVSGFSLVNHSDSGSFLGGTHMAQSRWMPARRILGGGRTHGVSFWHFPHSSSWWWLVSYMFLTRTSCHKITHRYGNCAWPG